MLCVAVVMLCTLYIFLGMSVIVSVSVSVIVIVIVTVFKLDQRIDGRTIFVYFKVKVWPRGPACGTNGRNDVPCSNFLAFFDLQFVAVCVQAGGTVPMVDNHNIPVSTPNS